MKKSNLIKVFSILVISLMVILCTTTVRADDNTGFNDLTNTLKNTSTNNDAANTNSNSNNSLLGNNTNVSNNSNNSSVYNDTSLPKTGITDSMPIAVLVVVFGISAVYAYKKIREYRNF